MGLEELFLGCSPALALAWIIGVEIPERWRIAMFVKGINGWKPPLFIITLSYGFFVKATLEGVLGSYGIFLTDIVLYPFLVWISRRTQARYNKSLRLVKKKQKTAA